MGKIDAKTYEYMSDNAHFADVFNYYLYNGKKVIDPDKLKEMDTRELSMPYGDDNVSDTIQKYRDILKYVCAMYDDNAAYLILGIENQAEEHYAMPVKNMIYDAAQYDKQVKRAASSHRNSEESKEINTGEFLSGFYKDDKLLPVITLVMYWSADEWKAPMTLHEMFSVNDRSILKFVPDYKINLVAPYNMSDEDFEKFETTLAKALKFIKYSKDDLALQNVLDNDKVYENIDRETAELIRDVTNSEMEFEEGQVINVCLAEQNMKKKAVRESAIETAKVLINMGKNTVEEISKATKLPIDEIRKLAEPKMQ